MSRLRLRRAVTADGPRVLVDRDGESAVATVDGHAFGDLPALLDACGGDLTAIRSGAMAGTGAAALALVGAPAKIVCIGLNYRMHAEESGAPIPEHPMVFAKWSTALTGPEDDIPLPAESSFVDWECELAFVFGRRCRRVTAADAADVLAGYTVANDVSMRDFQRHTSQFVPGKTWDRTTPVGPVLVPAAELGGADPDLAIRGRLNGRVVQDSRTSDLIFGIGALVAYLTTIMTMEPGDIVLTGTPSGVGQSADPPRSLADGDVFESEVEGIGVLRNRFVAEQA